MSKLGAGGDGLSWRFTVEKKYARTLVPKVGPS